MGQTNDVFKRILEVMILIYAEKKVLRKCGASKFDNRFAVFVLVISSLFKENKLNILLVWHFQSDNFAEHTACMFFQRSIVNTSQPHKLFIFLFGENNRAPCIVRCIDTADVGIKYFQFAQFKRNSTHKHQRIRLLYPVFWVKFSRYFFFFAL